MSAGVGARVLIADDEKHLASLLEHFLAARGHRVSVVHDGRHALDHLRAGRVDVALLDVQMPGLDGLAVLRESRALPLPAEVIVMTGNGTVDTAIAAMQGGAYDYVAKPYRMAEVDLLVRRALERRVLARTAIAAGAGLPEPDFRTVFAPLRAVVELVDRAAPSLHAMLLRGEPGTGRTLLARRVHRLAGGDVFVPVECATLHERQAGLADPLAAAGEGGTLFLRDVERLPPNAARELLELLAVSDTDSADAGALPRVIGATARARTSERRGSSPSAMLAERLAASMHVELPPLRARSADVALLAEAMVRELGGASPPMLAADAVRALERRAWPGNVAELRLVVARAVAGASDGVITAADLDPTSHPSTPSP